METNRPEDWRDWAWYALWGLVWTPIIAYVIRMVLFASVWRTLSPVVDLAFVIILFIAITIGVVRPYCRKEVYIGTE